VALAELGLDYEPVVLRAAEADETFNEINPCRRVPALQDGDQTLFESNDIVEYLLATYASAAEGGCDEPRFARSVCRPEHHWYDRQTASGIETLLDSGLILLQLRNDGITPDHSAYLRRERDRIEIILDWLEARASSEGFLPGQFSIQDMNLVISLQWSDYRGMFEWRNRPHLNAIVARYRDRPSVAETAPENAPV